MQPNPKSIYISYAQDDLQYAKKIKDLLETWFNSNSPVYIREFDLDAGSNIINSSHQAIDETKWFILVYTKNALNSDWVSNEVSISALKSMESQNFEVVILKIEDIQYPSHIRLFLNQKTVIDASSDFDSSVFELGDYISRSEIEVTEISDTYTNRGGDRDNFWSQVARKHKIAFLWGWSGIGKTSFIEHSVPEKLKKRPNNNFMLLILEVTVIFLTLD